MKTFFFNSPLFSIFVYHNLHLMTCFLVFSNVVEADATSMGGTASQEYHYLLEIGEGKLHTCQACNHSVERSDEDNNLNECHKCKSKNLAQRNGIEVFKFSYESE